MPNMARTKGRVRYQGRRDRGISWSWAWAMVDRFFKVYSILGISFLATLSIPCALWHHFICILLDNFRSFQSQCLHGCKVCNGCTISTLLYSAQLCSTLSLSIDSLYLQYSLPYSTLLGRPRLSLFNYTSTKLHMHVLPSRLLTSHPRPFVHACAPPMRCYADTLSSLRMAPIRAAPLLPMPALLAASRRDRASQPGTRTRLSETSMIFSLLSICSTVHPSHLPSVPPPEHNAAKMSESEEGECIEGVMSYL